MRILWAVEVKRGEHWKPSPMTRDTREGARKIARMFRSKGEHIRVVKYLPERCQ